MTPDDAIAEATRLLQLGAVHAADMSNLNSVGREGVALQVAAGAGFAQLALAMLAAEDARPITLTLSGSHAVTAKCGHGCTCFENAGHWLHVITLDICDQPPVQA